jgi:hypothetical protein
MFACLDLSKGFIEAQFNYVILSRKKTVLAKSRCHTTSDAAGSRKSV